MGNLESKKKLRKAKKEKRKLTTSSGTLLSCLKNTFCIVITLESGIEGRC